MPVVPSTWPNSAGDALALARALLNDSAKTTGSVYTDVRLLPYLNSGYRKLQMDLAVAGVKVNKGRAFIDLLAGGTMITQSPTAPDAGYPSDFIVPWELWEKGKDSDERYTQMTMGRSAIPDADQSQCLVWWEKVGDDIVTLGATRDITIRMDYEKQLPALGQANDGLRIRGAVDALAHYTAAMAASARGVDAAYKRLMAQYSEFANILIIRQVKPEQGTPIRRRPYGSRLRALR